MKHILHHMRTGLALLAMLSYLGLAVSMARGQGVVIVEGRALLLSDLCGGDGQAGGECPYCVLAKTTLVPVCIKAPHALHLAVPQRRIIAPALFVPGHPHARPQARGPPLIGL